MDWRGADIKSEKLCEYLFFFPLHANVRDAACIVSIYMASSNDRRPAQVYKMTPHSWGSGGWRVMTHTDRRDGMSEMPQNTMT